MASLKQVYSSFMHDPKADVLHSNAGLHYITTLTSFASSSAIATHLAREARLYKKKEQKIISSVETGDSLVLEVATTIEFVNGGGAILVGLDDNFLSDQTVIAPFVRCD